MNGQKNSPYAIHVVFPVCITAVYYNRLYNDGERGIPPPGTEITGDPELGCTVELCAGIVDKQKPLVQIAVEEIHEEMGFVVPATKLEKLASFR